MKKSLINRFMLSTLFISSFGVSRAQQIKDLSLSINTASVAGRVNDKIYGQLLEHIYHSINGGLWGEMIASRSFEPVSYRGWRLTDDELVSPGTRIGEISFGDASWKNMDLQLNLRTKPYFVGVSAPWSGGRSDVRIILGADAQKKIYAFHYVGNADTVFRLEQGTRDSKDRIQWVSLTKTVGRTGADADPALWHSCRAVSTGADLKLYWDGRLKFTYRFPATTEIGGKITLVVNGTEGHFKRIKVKSQHGAVLFRGFPDEVLPPGVAPDWMAYGQGKFILKKGNSKNGNYAQEITAHLQEAGVEQGTFNLTATNAYQGSLWAKGDGKVSLTVKFISGETTIAEQNLGKAVAVWKKYTFKLKPSHSSDQGKLRLTIQGGTIVIDQVSLMPSAAAALGGYRPDLFQATAALAPTSLRWPGGSFASGYNWKTGIGLQEDRLRIPKESWDDYEQNAFGTDEFVAYCRKLKAEPIIVVPIGYDHPDRDRAWFIRQAQEWLAYCNEPASGKWGAIRAKNGHRAPYHIRYWEIDNEMWEMGVEKYGQILREFVPALKKIDPSIQIIACGDFTEKGINRDSVLLSSSARYFDFLSLHHYESPGNYEKGPAKSAIRYQQAADMIKRSANPAIKIYVSEWNASELDWRTGLYAGGILNEFEKQPVITMAAGALFLRRTDASGWNNAFINFDYKGWFPAPNYVVTKLFRENFATVRLNITGGADSLNLVASTSDDGQFMFLKVVNPSNTTYHVHMKLKTVGHIQTSVLKFIAPGSLHAKNTMHAPARVAVQEARVKINNNDVLFTMPAISVGVLCLKISEIGTE